MKTLIHFFILVSFLASPLASQEQPEAKAEVKEAPPIIKMEPEKIIDNLKDRSKILMSVEAAFNLSSSSARKVNLLTLTGEIMIDPMVLKAERSDLLKKLVEKSEKKDEQKLYSQDALAEMLLLTLEKITSPSLFSQTVESLIRFENISNSVTEEKISKLVSEIILDAGEPARKRKYNDATVAIAVESVFSSDASKKVVDTLLDLLKRGDRLPAYLQTALFEALGNIARSDTGKQLSNSDKNALSNRLFDLADKHPAKLPGGFDDRDLKVFRAMIRPLAYLLPDKATSYSRGKTVSLFVDLLQHPDVQVIDTVTEGLTDLGISELQSTHSTIDVSEVLLKVFRARSKNMETPEQQQTAKIIMHQITRYLSAVLASTETRNRNKIAPLLSFLLDQFMGSENLDVKHMALDGLYGLEPAVLQNNMFPKDAKEVASKFFDDSMQVLKIKDESAAFNELKEHISKVLYEMTGKFFGTDTQEWIAWRESRDGKQLFN